MKRGLAPGRLALMGSCLPLRAFLAPSAWSIETSAVSQKPVTIESTTDYHIDNGFRYRMLPDFSTLSVTVHQTLLVGAAESLCPGGGKGHNEINEDARELLGFSPCLS